MCARDWQDVAHTDAERDNHASGVSRLHSHADALAGIVEPGGTGGTWARAECQLTPTSIANKFRVVSLAEHGKGGGAQLCFTRLPYDAKSFA